MVRRTITVPKETQKPSGRLRNWYVLCFEVLLYGLLFLNAVNLLDIICPKHLQRCWRIILSD